MEDRTLNHLQEAGEDRLGTVLLLSVLSALLDVSLKLIEEVIDDVGGEDSDAVVICELLGIGHHLHVEG